jgi:pSer/pThr/pTyr-binding forkhead associated (FHA) protein
MTKLIVTLNGVVQQEFSSNKPRINIGRRKTNDLFLDHLTVSGQHAAIDATLNGVFILDLGSTNGTKVNGQPIKKHFLQNEDVIEIGKYKVQFFVETTQPIIPAVKTEKASVAPSVAQNAAIPLAKIKVLNGNNAGREMILNKQTTNLGNPTVLVVAIMREKSGYFIKFVEGISAYRINEIAMNKQAHLLSDGDVLDLAGTKIVFTEVASKEAEY